MIVGYARTSTVEQEAGFAAQIRDLQQQGCERIFQEQVSSVAKRAQLETALDFVREGDTFVVTKIDRLARSTRNLLDIVERLNAKSVTLRILAMNLDTSTPTGKLMLGVLGSVAQFEREMMLERQREGIAKAMTAGKYKGRKPTAMNQADRIRELRAEDLSMARIAKQLGIGVASVHRVLAGID